MITDEERAARKTESVEQVFLCFILASAVCSIIALFTIFDDGKAQAQDRVSYEEANRICEFTFVPSYTPEVTEPKYRVFKKTPKCKTYDCFYDAAPNGQRGRRTLSVFLTNKLPARVIWGSLGWAKSVAVLNDTVQIPFAVEIARGVELNSLLRQPELIEGDRDFHDRHAEELRCLKVFGYPHTSLREWTPVPFEIPRNE